MPLQSSGQISLDDLHVEAGGTSGTQCSMNDSDIRGLVNASANSQMTFSSFYGASAVQPYSAVITIGYSVFKTSNYVGYEPIFSAGSISPTAVAFKNNGNATWYSFYVYYNSSTSTANTFTLNIGFMNCGTDLSNSGWSSVSVNGYTFNRTAFSYSSTAGGTFNGSISYGLTLSYNPFAGLSSGTTRTAVFT